VEWNVCKQRRGEGEMVEKYCADSTSKQHDLTRGNTFYYQPGSQFNKAMIVKVNMRL